MKSGQCGTSSNRSSSTSNFANQGTLSEGFLWSKFFGKHLFRWCFVNCSFLHASVSLQRLAGFAGRFYEFPNDIGPLFHRASSQSIKGIHILKETNHKPPQNNRKITGKYQRSGLRVLHSGKKSGWPESSGGLGVTSSLSGECLHWYCSRTANSTTAHVSGSWISS